MGNRPSKLCRRSTQRGTRGARIPEAERARGKRVARVAGHGQFPQSSRSGTTVDGLEAGGRLTIRAVLLRHGKDGGEVAHCFLCGDDVGSEPVSGTPADLYQYSVCHLLCAKYCTQQILARAAY